MEDGVQIVEHVPMAPIDVDVIEDLHEVLIVEIPLTMHHLVQHILDHVVLIVGNLTIHH